MILVLGSGRSGTTLLAKLLDSHPNVLYRHEPDSIYPNPDIPFRPTREDISSYIDITKSYLHDLKNARFMKSSTHSPVFHKAYRNKLQNIVFLNVHHVMKILGARLEMRVFQEKLLVPDLISRTHKNDIVYVVKSVSALNRAYLFSCSEPKVKIIHIVRHPCGVVASRIRGISQGTMKKNVFLNTIESMEESKKFPISIDEIRRCSLEEQIAYQWAILNDKVIGELDQCDRYKLVKYEDLCLGLMETSADLFKYCGIEMADQSRRFIEMLESQQEGDRRYFSIIRAPKEAATKWKKDLTAAQIARITNIVSHSRVGSMYITSNY